MAETPPITVQVFARVPVAGAVKTRLIPHLGAERAAQLQARLCEHVLVHLRGLPDAQPELWLDGDTGHPWVQAQLAADPRLQVRAQCEGDIGARMANALALGCARGPTLLIGSDCPGLDARYLGLAISALHEQCEFVLGPVEDGGYVAIGLRRSVPELFVDIPWSTSTVAARTRALAARLQLRVFELPMLWDVDRPEDVERLYALPGWSPD